MRNPLAHLVHRSPDKPTLRDRAAALKATAGRVMGKKLKAHAPVEGARVTCEADHRQPAPLEPLMVRWREAAKASGADADEGTRLADIMTAAEHEIIRAEVTSVRDLACKIELLGTYRGVHDLDYGLPKFLLDAICKDVEALTRAEASKPSVSPHNCPAGRIALQLERTGAEIFALDEGGANNLDATPDLAAAMLRAEERFDALGMALSYARASSPGGMLGQLAVASGAVDLAANGSTRQTREESRAQADRCLNSVAAAICAQSGINRDGYGAGRLMPSWLDQLSDISGEIA